MAVGARREFFPAEESGPYLRLSFAAAGDVDELAEGVRRLGEARLGKHVRSSAVTGKETTLRHLHASA